MNITQVGLIVEIEFSTLMRTTEAIAIVETTTQPQARLHHLHMMIEYVPDVPADDPPDQNVGIQTIV